MSTIPPNVSERLSTVSRAMRVTSLQREVQTQAFLAGDMSPRELEEAHTRFNGAKQVVLRRLVQAIEQCDLAAAEEHLHLALSYSARVKGCNQVQTPHSKAA